MNLPDAPTPEPRRWTTELRVGLIAAGLMLAIPLGVKLAARFGWRDSADSSQRALMAILATYIVLTGNTIPKRLASLACLGTDPARVQAFYRFAGWAWVLMGIAFGAGWILLPIGLAGGATLIIMPLGIALIAYRWLRLYTARQVSA